MTGAPSLRDLLARVEAAKGPDRDLDKEILKTLFRHLFLTCKPVGTFDDEDLSALMSKQDTNENAISITASLDAATLFVEIALPGFWQSSGLCSLTGHASIGPDYNGPDAERLRREWPEERFHEGFHADLKPGDGRHRQCLALVHCGLQGLMAASGNDVSSGS